MKILIVFTTHNTGSSESYEGTWGCIDEKYGFRHKIINNKQAEIYVFKGSRFYDEASKDWQYSRIVEKLKNTVKKYDGAVFTVLFHATEQKDMLCEKLKKDKSIEALITSGDLLIKGYSSAIDEIWANYITSFCDKSANIGDNFNSLWSYLWRNALLTEAHSLRAEILSPLVALDLIKQAEANDTDVTIDENLKTQVGNAISNLTGDDEGENENPIAAFCEKCIKCDGFREKLNDLLNDTDRGWSSYHSDLEHVAQKMEEQIELL